VSLRLFISDSRAALWLVALLARSSASKDAVLPVPHHEVSILRRTIAKPRLDWADRAVLAAPCRLVPDAVRSRRLVTSDTILRWHRRLDAKNERTVGRLLVWGRNKNEATISHVACKRHCPTSTSRLSPISAARSRLLT